MAFLRHRKSPAGPVLLRDLLGTTAGREQKTERIQEILDLHPELRFILIGDSAEHDPEIYAAITRAHPGRIPAAYISEARLNPATVASNRSPEHGTRTCRSSSPPTPCAGTPPEIGLLASAGG